MSESTGTHVIRVEIDGIIVLTPVGEFDIANLDILRDTIATALEESSRIVLDLSQTQFLDSMVLGAIIGSSKRAREAGGWVRLVAPRPNVRNVLRVTRLDTILGLYDTVDQAVAHTESSAAPDPSSDSAAPA